MEQLIEKGGKKAEFKLSMEKRGKKRAIVSVNGKKRNEERGWNS